VTYTIALAGKGGTGKTTVAGMIVRMLVRNGAGSVLAIDADPSSNLHSVLGLPLHGTVGDIREDMLDQIQTTAEGALAGTMPGGMTKQDYLDYHIRMLLTEGENVDLIAMGRPEGPGCYCPANHILRAVIDHMGASYDYVVMDNEAGMEHLSRRTTRDVNLLLVITDPTQRGLTAAGRIAALRHELNINVEQAHLIVNGLRGDELPAPLAEAISTLDVPLLGTIPYDETLLDFELTGRPLIELGDDSPVYQAVSGMIGPLLKIPA
jgi:CO dehydrogenase maturation factor